jgi:endogenous inhibitor of DNA gyrase (YacG/DUF329 family)
MTVDDRLLRIRAAVYTAEHCAQCDRQLGRFEPVWRSRIALGISFIYGTPTYGIVPLCEACKPTSREFKPARPCEACGRPVHNLDTGQYRHNKFCSQRCRQKIDIAYTRRQRARAREITCAMRPCATCGTEFKPARRDARYCSPRCRQKAHRQRVTDNESGIRYAFTSRDAQR